MFLVNKNLKALLFLTKIVHCKIVILKKHNKVNAVLTRQKAWGLRNVTPKIKNKIRTHFTQFMVAPQKESKIFNCLYVTNQ